MKVKKPLIFLLLTISGFFLSSSAQKPINTEVENHILDTISKLPEVIERQSYVQKQTKGKRSLKIVLFEKPNKTFQQYWIKVMEANGINDYTHFNFFVNPKTKSITFLDTQKDKLLSLQEWRAHKH